MRRALQSGRHRTIAMVLSDITNPHFFELIRGAEQRAKAAATPSCIVNAEESPRIELEQIQTIAASVDGFVLASSRLTDDDLREVAAEHQIVLLNRELPGPRQRHAGHRLRVPSDPRAPRVAGSPEFTYCAGPPSSWMGAARWAALAAAPRRTD